MNLNFHTDKFIFIFKDNFDITVNLIFAIINTLNIFLDTKIIVTHENAKFSYLDKFEFYVHRLKRSRTK